MDDLNLFFTEAEENREKDLKEFHWLGSFKGLGDLLKARRKGFHVPKNSMCYIQSDDEFLFIEKVKPDSLQGRVYGWKGTCRTAYDTFHSHKQSFIPRK